LRLDITDLRTFLNVASSKLGVLYNNKLCGALCRTLYWADWNITNPGIYRSSVINPARETVVDVGHYAPTALAINFTGKHNTQHQLSGLKTSIKHAVFSLHLQLLSSIFVLSLFTSVYLSVFATDSICILSTVSTQVYTIVLKKVPP